MKKHKKPSLVYAEGGFLNNGRAIIMAAITIDTYELISSLKDTGVPELQAKAQIDVIAKFVDASREQIEHDHKLDDVATKRDIAKLELKMELVKSELKRDMADNKAELIRWVIGAGFLQTALIAGLVLKLANKI